MARFKTWIAFAAVAMASLSLATASDAARKGTRNYQPGDDTPAASSDRQTATSKGGQALDRCLASWDADTHMSKEEWRESCQRVIRERASQPGT
jgi:hypothetical protein